MALHENGRGKGGTAGPERGAAGGPRSAAKVRALKGLEELAVRFDRAQFDLVAVGRAVRQDAEWVEKVRDDRSTEIRAFDAQSLQTLIFDVDSGEIMSDMRDRG